MKFYAMKLGGYNMYEYCPNPLQVEEALKLVCNSIEFTHQLESKLISMDQLTTMQELFEGRSLIQEIYNELNYQIYMLKQLGLEDNNVKIKYDECIEVAKLLETRSGIPWDGRDLCI